MHPDSPAATGDLAQQPVLGLTRHTIMTVMEASVFTPTERLLANHNVHECEDSQRLARWLHNIQQIAQAR